MRPAPYDHRKVLVALAMGMISHSKTFRTTFYWHELPSQNEGIIDLHPITEEDKIVEEINQDARILLIICVFKEVGPNLTRKKECRIKIYLLFFPYICIIKQKQKKILI